MKSELSSVDISILTRELNKLLKNARIDNIYQIGERELKIRVFTKERGVEDLIITPKFLCISRYVRKSPEKPTSFAMQMRKYLKGLFIKDVRQYNFDRIVKFSIEGKNIRYLLISEFFSSGNIILCDEGGRILGILEWQKWRHRRLGVGQIYKYPPKCINPTKINEDTLKEIIQGSNRRIVSILAIDLNLGGLIAEEICLRAGINKEIDSSSIKDDEIGEILKNIKNIMKKVENYDIEPLLILDSDNYPIDAIPFSLKIYSRYKSKKLKSFNLAVDELFSMREIEEKRRKIEDVFKKKLTKLQRIEEEQRRNIERLKEEYKNSKRIGDLIYQNFHCIDEIINTVKSAKKMGYSWDEINNKLSGKTIDKLKILTINKDGSIILKYDI